MYGSREELIGKDPLSSRRASASPFPSFRRTASAWDSSADVHLADNMVAPFLPPRQIDLYRPPLAPRTGRIRGAGAERKHAERGYARAPSLRRQRAEGACRPRDRKRADRAAHGVCRCGVWISIRRIRSMTLSTAQKESRCCRYLRRRGSGRAAGAVRPYPCSVRRQGQRHRLRPRREKSARSA